MEFSIEKKVFKLLTDSASNMCKAGRDLNELNEEEEDYEKRLAGFVKTRWWSLLFMLKSVLLALKAPNEAIDKLIDEMQWGLRFTDRDIRDMDLLIGILSPFEELFSKLNGENYSTIQRVYPSVLEVLEILKNRVEDQSISVGAKNFCSSLKDNFVKYFSFVYNTDDENFNAIYMTSSFLDPFYRKLILDEHVSIVKDYLLKHVKIGSGGEGG